MQFGVPTQWDFTHPETVLREILRWGLPLDRFRLSTLNRHYRLCSTYPGHLVFPAAASDEIIEGSAQFRARKRMPAICWYNKRKGSVLARCAQPRAGVVGKTSRADEQLVQVR